MKFKYKTILSFVVLMSLPLFVLANDSVPMADLMRSSGKIYVVVAVLVIIFIGIVLFLIGLDKKIRRLEKNAE